MVAIFSLLNQAANMSLLSLWDDDDDADEDDDMGDSFDTNT